MANGGYRNVLSEWWVTRATSDKTSGVSTVVVNRLFNAGGVTVYALTAQAGAYSLTGIDATILKHRNLTASSGSYSLSGQSAGITYIAGTVTYTLQCLAGSYVISGQDVSILKHRNLVAANGAYTLFGQAATISRNRNLTASSGSYFITGSDATILKHRNLTASSGAYTLTGISATLTHTGSGSPVFPNVGDVRYGITYGPTGADYTGTLDLGNKFRLDIATGNLVMVLDGKKVMSL